VCIGSIFPVLCINFFNHLGGTSKLYQYIHVDEKKLKVRYEARGRYNFFPEHGCCLGFYKSRIFVMAILQLIFTLIYSSVPAIMLLVSQGSVESNILLGLTETDDWVTVTLQVCFGVGIFASLCFQYTPMLVQEMRKFLLSFPSLIESVYRYCYNSEDDNFHYDDYENNLSRSYKLDIFLTLGVLLFGFGLVVFAPANLDTWLNLMRLPCASLMMLVFPAMIHLITLRVESLKDSDQNKAYDFTPLKGTKAPLCRNFRKCDLVAGFLSIVIIIVGLLISVLSTLLNVKQLMKAS
jgi:uncharacterized BrkB/YihY/UPF0761 family membrane protein